MTPSRREQLRSQARITASSEAGPSSRMLIAADELLELLEPNSRLDAIARYWAQRALVGEPLPWSVGQLLLALEPGDLPGVDLAQMRHSIEPDMMSAQQMTAPTSMKFDVLHLADDDSTQGLHPDGRKVRPSHGCAAVPPRATLEADPPEDLLDQTRPVASINKFVEALANPASHAAEISLDSGPLRDAVTQHVSKTGGLVIGPVRFDPAECVCRAAVALASGPMVLMEFSISVERRIAPPAEGG